MDYQKPFKTIQEQVWLLRARGLIIDDDAEHYLRHLTYLRNLCVHHSRVWNRKFTKIMQLPKTKPEQLINSFNTDPSQERKIYNTLVMLLHFLNIISPEHHIKQHLIDLFEQRSIKVAAMGFPTDWKKRDIWFCR